MGNKASVGILDDVLEQMARPDSGIPDVADPYFGVDYEDGLEEIGEVEVPPGVPEAFLWRLLIMPAQPRAMSKGGIALPNKVMEAEEHLNYIGKVINMGPLAGWSWRFFRLHLSPWPWKWITRHYDVKPGDWVIYGRYTGQKCWFRGAKMIFVNDDEILGKAKGGPVGFKIYAA